MRQRALTANVGTIADIAGTMSVMAGRGGGINMKIRGSPMPSTASTCSLMLR